MTNFEYLKTLESEYAATDSIMNFISEHLSEIVNKDEPEIHSLPLLKWMQTERKSK